MSRTNKAIEHFKLQPKEVCSEVLLMRLDAVFSIPRQVWRSRQLGSLRHAQSFRPKPSIHHRDAAMSRSLFEWNYQVPLAMYNGSPATHSKAHSADG